MYKREFIAVKNEIAYLSLQVSAYLIYHIPKPNSSLFLGSLYFLVFMANRLTLQIMNAIYPNTHNQAIL